MFNTALEEAVDLAYPAVDPKAKIAKDISAGAVLTSAITAIIVGLFLFGPPLWEWIRGLF
jgi:diacylglycerol kinase